MPLLYMPIIADCRLMLTLMPDFRLFSFAQFFWSFSIFLFHCQHCLRYLFLILFISPFTFSLLLLMPPLRLRHAARWYWLPSFSLPLFRHIAADISPPLFRCWYWFSFRLFIDLFLHFIFHFSFFNIIFIFDIYFLSCCRFTWYYAIADACRYVSMSFTTLCQPQPVAAADHFSITTASISSIFTPPFALLSLFSAAVIFIDYASIFLRHFFLLLASSFFLFDAASLYWFLSDALRWFSPLPPLLMAFVDIMICHFHFFDTIISFHFLRLRRYLRYFSWLLLLFCFSLFCCQAILSPLSHCRRCHCWYFHIIRCFASWYL